MALDVLVCYNVVVDNVRARCSAYLQQWGTRIQKSVFMCEISPDDMPVVVAHLSQLLDLETDSVYLVPLCTPCYGKMEVIGQAHPPDRQFFWIAI